MRLVEVTDVRAEDELVSCFYICNSDFDEDKMLRKVFAKKVTKGIKCNLKLTRLDNNELWVHRGSTAYYRLRVLDYQEPMWCHTNRGKYLRAHGLILQPISEKDLLDAYYACQ